MPVDITRPRGIKPGTRFEWRTTERQEALEVVILPDTASVAASLRGAGNRFRRLPGSPVDRLVAGRAREDQMERMT